MSLSLELERNIREAWLRVRKEILDDPAELHRRLARRRSKTLTRPPRAWCIAVRACDRRITPAHWVITPEHAMDLDHPDHPYEPIEHEVTIRKHGIRLCCNPATFSREDAADVAKILGVSPGTLFYARRQGRFYETYIPRLGGKRGHPVPLLDGGRQLLDPSHRNFARPHPIWGADWEFLSRQFPQDFEQSIIRKPVFRRMTRKSASPTEAGWAEYAYKDEMKFLGWRWVCPGCGKLVRIIYYPMPVRSMFDRWFTDPVIHKKLSDADLPEVPPPTFACQRCHRVKFFSSVHHDAWNDVVGYLTAGLLYGCEVRKPAGFVAERRRTRVRQLSREAPMRRKVLTRLSNGWSNFQIARDLGMSCTGVCHHIRRICEEKDVPDRHALAKKLNFAASPPPNQVERALTRRFAVRQMLLENCSLREMCGKLSASMSVITADIGKIFKLYGIKSKKGTSLEGRRALARNLGVPFSSRGDHLREKIAKLCDSGMSHRQVAKEVGISRAAVWWHMAKWKKARLLQEAADVPLPCP